MKASSHWPIRWAAALLLLLALTLTPLAARPARAQTESPTPLNPATLDAFFAGLIAAQRQIVVIDCASAGEPVPKARNDAASALG